LFSPSSSCFPPAVIFPPGSRTFPNSHTQLDPSRHGIGAVADGGASVTADPDLQQGQVSRWLVATCHLGTCIAAPAPLSYKQLLWSRNAGNVRLLLLLLLQLAPPSQHRAFWKKYQVRKWGVEYSIFFYGKSFFAIIIIRDKVLKL
jgi:hypothetical protein